jgi:hypothetical protein
MARTKVPRMLGGEDDVDRIAVLRGDAARAAAASSAAAAYAIRCLEHASLTTALALQAEEDAAARGRWLRRQAPSAPIAGSSRH